MIRTHATDSPWVTWGEFVGARLLAESRRGVPGLTLHPALEWLRDHTGEPYPPACSFFLHYGVDVVASVVA